MAFIPSKYSLADLTVSATASRRGMSNQPASESHGNNLNRLAAFLESIPFQLRINSAYRSPEVNRAVGGSSTSQHPNGLAADITPIGMTNKQLATWLWANRADYPELDQVIWYTDTSHVHVGICPPGSTGCVGGAPRQHFYYARKEGSKYNRWLPEEAEMKQVLAMYAETRPIRTATIAIALTAGISIAAVLIAIAVRARSDE